MSTLLVRIDIMALLKLRLLAQKKPNPLLKLQQLNPGSCVDLQGPGWLLA